MVANGLFGAQSTADDVLEGKRLDGMRVLVTGGSGGIGKEAARALACHGAEVILAARSEEKLAQAKREIELAMGDGEVSTLQLDLASLASVRQAAESFLARGQSLDVLINNAGVMACPLSRTADGFEMQFGVCHLGHFLFTCLLVPALLQGTPARVVNLSSGGHQIADVDFEDPNYRNREYNKWESYGQAKTANVLFSLGLNQRLAVRGITSSAVHPGAIAETDLARHMQPADFEELMSMQPAGTEITFKSLQAGAATSVWAATAVELEGEGGLYLEDCQLGQRNDSAAIMGGYRERALDPKRAEKLWHLTEELIGQRFSW